MVDVNPMKLAMKLLQVAGSYKAKVGCMLLRRDHLCLCEHFAIQHPFTCFDFDLPVFFSFVVVCIDLPRCNMETKEMVQKLVH